MGIVVMCHHVDEALSWSEIERRHRSEAADDEPERTTEEPVEPDESGSPAEPSVPADD